MENVKAGSERLKGAGNSLSLPLGPNRDPTPSGASSPTLTVSDRIQFVNLTLQNSGEEAVPGLGWGGHWDRSLGTGRFRRRTRTEGKIWVVAW